MWVRGRARRLRVETWQAGDVVTVAGERRPLDAGRRSRVAWQHVVGTFEPDWLGDVDAGGQFVDGIEPRARRDPGVAWEAFPPSAPRWPAG